MIQDQDSTVNPRTNDKNERMDVSTDNKPDRETLPGVAIWPSILVLCFTGCVLVGLSCLTCLDTATASLLPTTLVNIDEHARHIMGFQLMMGTDYKGSLYFNNDVTANSLAVLDRLGSLKQIKNDHSTMYIRWWGSGVSLIGLTLIIVALAVKSLRLAKRGVNSDKVLLFQVFLTILLLVGALAFCEYRRELDSLCSKAQEGVCDCNCLLLSIPEAIGGVSPEHLSKHVEGGYAALKCPSGGTYAAEPDRKVYTCSVHRRSE